jgi:hypothetical protein
MAAMAHALCKRVCLQCNFFLDAASRTNDAPQRIWTLSPPPQERQFRSRLSPIGLSFFRAQVSLLKIELSLAIKGENRRKICKRVAVGVLKPLLQ